MRVLYLVCLIGCSAAPPEPLRHEFPLVTVAPGEETDQLCQSWTLDNADAIDVNAIAMHNLGGFHHSNWFFVSEDTFAGPDGTWDCASRNYDQSTAALIGGVAFAQSTQARDEELAFVDGAAYRIPPRSRIVGQLHLLNPSDAPIDTGVAFELQPIAKADILMSPAVFVYQTIAIPPLARSRFQADCDLEKSYGAPLDFRFYYMLPHYHALGTAMNLVADTVDGPRSVFGSEGQIGDVKSKKLDPPFDTTGSSHVKFSCDYANPRDETIYWGNADQEMCILVAWTDSPYILFSGVFTDDAFVGEQSGVLVHQGTCGVSFVNPRT